METSEKVIITVAATIKAPIDKVWKFWTDPQHITRWNSASDEWHTPHAENDVKDGGRFLWRMEAKDGSAGFDFSGEYTRVVPEQLIEYRMDDDRKVQILFESKGNETDVTEAFEAESMNSVDMQQEGWLSILHNFKKHVEASSKIEKLHFEIAINAKPEKVYNCMLEKPTYNEWTKVFNPTSEYEGSWEKGAKILFKGTGEDGSQGGMVSRIRENIPNKFVSIEHIGILDNGKEIMSGPEVENWAGSQENYTFKEENGKTLVSVDLDSTEQFRDYFSETFPKALNVLKDICER